MSEDGKKKLYYFENKLLKYFFDQELESFKVKELLPNLITYS